ncbi:TolC family protein [Acinetobacter sp. P1(2025)]|uniref:TolC family protein n=1 Tax=Acinetobacter sp. P1(2025) TaxID=3446120 RepID=UPI003F5368EC
MKKKQVCICIGAILVMMPTVQHAKIYPVSFEEDKAPQDQSLIKSNVVANSSDTSVKSFNTNNQNVLNNSSVGSKKINTPDKANLNIQGNISFQKNVGNSNEIVWGSTINVKNKSEFIKKGEGVFFSRWKHNDEKYYLTDVLRRAVDWNPSIKLADSGVKLSEISIKTAKSAYYPKASMKVETGYEDDSYGNTPFKSDLVLDVSQMIYDFGKTKSNVGLAQATLGKESKLFKSSLDDVVYTTSKAYLEIVRYNFLVKIAEDQVKGLEELNRIAKRRTELGASAYSDYSQSQDSLAEAVSAVFEYRSQLRKWIATLNTITNKDIGDHIYLRFNHSDSTKVCSDINVNKINPSKVELAEAQVEMAEKQLDAAKANLFPTLSLVPRYSYEIAGEDNYYNVDRDKGRAGILLKLDVPLFQGGALISKKQEAQQALISAKYNVDTEKYKARESLLEASSQIDNILNSLESKFYKEDYTVKTRDLYKLQFIELGNRSFLDLLSAERSIYNNQMNIINSYYNIDSLALECLYQSGKLNTLLPYAYNTTTVTLNK